MKKLTKIFAVLTLLFSMFASLGFGVNEVAEAANTDQVSVTLHKKKMIALPEFQQNTGEKMDFFSSYDDMPNVTFEVRDVTAQFYGLRAGNMPFGDALSAVADAPDGPIIHTGTTGADGQVHFDLANKSGGKDAIYVFVETVAPAGTTKADNLVLALPMYDDDNELMTDILLYPKNLVKADGRVTVTKKGTAEGNDLLEGAQFIVSRELTEDNIEYIASFNMEKGLYNWVADRDDALPFTTNSAGTFSILGLEHGDYKLIEIVRPDNASIIGDGITEFTIQDNDTNIALTVYNDTIIVIKDHEGTQDDYNVGDLIPYSIVVNIPQGMGYQLPGGGYRHPELIITDTPDVGLQYNDDLALRVGETEIAIDASWMDTTGNGFIITIPAAALAAFEGQDLTLTYNMFLDENANPDVAYKNVATVTTEELTDNDYGPEVFTGGHKFRKVDANFDTQNALAGAVFVVRDGDADDARYLNIGADNAVTWVATLAEATVFETEADGLINVAGLEYGTYFLEEIEAPADYVLLEERVPFTVAKGSYTENLRLDVTNIRKGILPSTGGSGIIGIVSLGAVLIATTGGYYIKRRRDA